MMSVRTCRSFAIWSRAEDDEDVPAPPIRRVPAHSRGTEVNSCASFALADSLVPWTATPPGFSSPAYEPGDRRVITYQGYTRPCAGAARARLLSSRLTALSDACSGDGAATSQRCDRVTRSVRRRQRRGPAGAVVGVLSDPPILVFSLRIGKGLMTFSMPDRFRLAAPRGRRRRIGMAVGLLEQSWLASCPRPGRAKSTPLARRRIAVWRLKWPPRVARAQRDGRGGSCACGWPRDVGHRCERWRVLERDRGAAFEPPVVSQVLLGIKQLEPNGQVLLRRPDCVRGHSGPPGVGWFANARIETPAGPKKVGACCAVAGVTLFRRARRHSC